MSFNKMTAYQKQMIERNKIVYAFYLANPLLTYEEIGKKFDLRKGVVGNLVRREKESGKTGRPSYSSKKPRTRSKRGRYMKALKTPQVTAPKVNKDELIMQQLNVQF